MGSSPPHRIVVTQLMQNTMDRIRSVHACWPLVVVSGASHTGKTTTALLMRDQLNAQPESDPADGYRAVHFTIAPESKRVVRDCKGALVHLFTETLHPLTVGECRYTSKEELAKRVVLGLRRQSVQLLLVDEAGYLALDALGAYVLVRDVAASLGWPLSIVLIGMGHLPVTVGKEPQLYNRIQEWIRFVPYSLAETRTLLATLHPHFSPLLGHNRSTCGELEQEAAFIHEEHNGVVGNIVPFLNRLDFWAKRRNLMIDMKLIRSVHFLRRNDEERTIEDEERGYEVRADGDAEGPNRDGAAGRSGRGGRRAATRAPAGAA